MLNTKINIEDSEFALKDGLLPKSISKGKIIDQLFVLGENAGITEKSIIKVIQNLTSKEDKVEDLISKSYLSEKLKRNYLQNYQRKLKRLDLELRK